MKLSICLKCKADLSTNNAHYGLHHKCFQKWFTQESLKDFSGIERHSNDSMEPFDQKKDEPWVRSFFHGKFKKYSALLGNDSFIFKVKEDPFPELPDVEYVCNEIAQEVGLPVAEFYVIEFYDERVFVTKNFIRSRSTHASLDHIWHYLKDGQEYNCENILNIIATETQLFVDIETFIKTCLFDSLIGNHDRHVRNLGLIVTPKGKTLAPIYDNSSALGLEKGEFLKAFFEPKGKLFTHASKEPTIKHYIQEFKRLEYSETVTDFFQKIKPEKIKKMITESYCSDLMKNALINLFSSRYKEMQNELSS